VSTPDVNDEQLIRLSSFKRVCAERGLGAQQLAALFESRYSFWRELLAGKKSFGEKLARRIEDKLGLPTKWLDTGGDLPKGLVGAPSPAGLAVAQTYDRMSSKQQELFLKLLEASFGAVPEERPPELGHSDLMDIDLDLGEPANVNKEKRR
jgi:hypothetical protein